MQYKVERIEHLHQHQIIPRASITFINGLGSLKQEACHISAPFSIQLQHLSLLSLAFACEVKATSFLAQRSGTLTLFNTSAKLQH
jgi:hypothetical protein